jgi:hypothetical protein
MTNDFIVEDIITPANLGDYAILKVGNRRLRGMKYDICMISVKVQFRARHTCLDSQTSRDFFVVLNVDLPTRKNIGYNDNSDLFHKIFVQDVFLIVTVIDTWKHREV